MSFLGASVWMSSGPAALIFFGYFMVLLISSLVGFSHVKGRYNAAGCVSVGSSGASMFRSYSKCSTHLWSCCSVPVMFLPCLSYTRLVVSYSYLMFHFACRCSFVCQFSHFFTSQLDFVCSFCANTIATRIRLLFSADLFSFAPASGFCCDPIFLL